MTRQEGYACSFGKLGSLVGAMKVAMKVTNLRSPHGESIGENMSPRSVLEHRALSGLAIAINLEEKKKKSKPSHAQEDHVIVGRYCCKEKISHMRVGQEANSHLIVSNSLSRERLTHMIHKERETASDAPIVGLRMVASLYPMLHLNNPEARRHENLVMGRSVSRERLYMEVMGCHERQKSSCVVNSLDGERKQGNNVYERGPNVSMSSSPPFTCKSEESRGFLAGTSAEESIFYYVNPSSSDISHIFATEDDSPMENFLKICFFCKCHLGMGKDIYMYRGDQAFCSAECRYQQIMIDECMGLTA